MFWNDQLNFRRCELIDREIDGSLLPHEMDELRGLQSSLDAYLEEVAPRPWDALRAMEAKLRRLTNGE